MVKNCHYVSQYAHPRPTRDLLNGVVKRKSHIYTGATRSEGLMRCLVCSLITKTQVIKTASTHCRRNEKPGGKKHVKRPGKTERKAGATRLLCVSSMTLTM